ISPRLAIRTLSNSFSDFAANSLRDDEQRLTEFDRLAVLGDDRLDRAADVRLDLVHQLHRLDDAENVALLNRIADLDERFPAGGGSGRGIERSHHRALDDVAFGFGGRGRLGGGRCSGRRRWRSAGKRRERRAGSVRSLPERTSDPDALFALLDLQLGYTRRLD